MLSCRVSILDAFFSTNIYATARYFLGVGGTGRFPEHVFVQCALAVLYVGRYHGRRGCTVYVRGAEEGGRFFVFFPCGVAVFGGDDSIKIRAFLKHRCAFSWRLTASISFAYFRVWCCLLPVGVVLVG